MLSYIVIHVHRLGNDPLLYSIVHCSPQYTREIYTCTGCILPQYPFTVKFSLMWELGGAKSFDVAAGSSQDMHSQYVLPLVWGRHCYSSVTISHVPWLVLRTRPPHVFCIISMQVARSCQTHFSPSK